MQPTPVGRVIQAAQGWGRSALSRRLAIRAGLLLFYRKAKDAQDAELKGLTLTLTLSPIP